LYQNQCLNKINTKQLKTCRWQSNWIISPNRGENKTCLQPPPRKNATTTWFQGIWIFLAPESMQEQYIMQLVSFKKSARFPQYLCQCPLPFGQNELDSNKLRSRQVAGSNLLVEDLRTFSFRRLAWSLRVLDGRHRILVFHVCQNACQLGGLSVHTASPVTQLRSFKIFQRFAIGELPRRITNHWSNIKCFNIHLHHPKVSNNP